MERGKRTHQSRSRGGFGNLTSTTTPSGTTTINYDIAGNVAQRYVNGELTTNTVSSTTNYAVPSAMTTVNLTSSVNWTGSLAPSSATGPNGDSASINYDTLARPQSSVSPYGATTTYAYNDTAPATRTATTNGHWTRTTLDGFGRTTKSDTGDAGGTKSTVDTVYDSCGCNPMGKMVKTSMPYAPNGTVYWKQNTYDGLGRTVSATEARPLVISPSAAWPTTPNMLQALMPALTDSASQTQAFMIDSMAPTNPRAASGSRRVSATKLSATTRSPRPTRRMTRAPGSQASGRHSIYVFLRDRAVSCCRA